jgi:putative methyltransferase (TIGR04325 family)
MTNKIVFLRLQRRLKPWIPPALLDLVYRMRDGYAGLRGDYPDWKTAKHFSTGYSTNEITSRVSAVAEEVTKSDGRLFDRDSVIFDRPITPFPLLAVLLQVACKNGGRLNVLDFGGALGSTYRQCLPFFGGLSHLRWSIVEQTCFVDVGKDRFTSDQLQFYRSIEDAVADGRPDVVLLSGVLQYLDDPYDVLRRVVLCEPQVIVVDRNPFSSEERDVFSTQIVAGKIYPARLAFRIFASNSLERALAPKYRKFSEFDAIDPRMKAESIDVRHQGKVFELSQGG